MRRRTVVSALLALPLIALIPGPAQAAPLYGETHLVSTSHEDAVFGERAEFAAISKDGLRAFWTTTESLLSEDSDSDNVDIYQRADNTTTRLVTPGGDFDATFLAISEDGSKVLFSTTEALPGDGDANVDIYRRDMEATPPTTTLMTPGTQEFVRFRGSNLAADRVFFETDERLTGGDTDEETDVYLSHDGSLTRISTGSHGGNNACAARYSGSTPDGLHVFFQSEEVLTSDDDSNDNAYSCDPVHSDRGTPDIFHWNGGAVSNLTPRGGCSAGGGTGCKADRFARAALDGSRVIFNSSNYHDRDLSRCNDDVWQTVGGVVSLLSTSQWDGTDENCHPGKGYYNAAFVGASADATKVFWVTSEPGMAGATDDNKDIFLTSGGSSTLMSPNTPNDGADFEWTTPDGDHLFFGTSDPVTDDGDTANDVFQNTRGTITKVSTGPEGGNGAFDAHLAAATDDAGHIFFSTSEPLTSDEPAGSSSPDLFVRYHDELENAWKTERISTGPLDGTAGYSVGFDGVSEDAERVFFTTQEKLVRADTDQEQDVYMRWQGGPPSVRIDELALAPDAFVELLKSGSGQDEFPADQGPYKLAVYDGDARKVGEHVIAPTLLRTQARPLFSDTHPRADEPLEVDLPPVGQLCFTQGAGELRVSCVAWGCIATPVDPAAVRVAAPGAEVSQQRQGDAPDVFHLAPPTPKDVNVAGTTAPACPHDPDPEPGPDDPGPALPTPTVPGPMTPVPSVPGPAIPDPPSSTPPTRLTVATSRISGAGSTLRVTVVLPGPGRVTTGPARASAARTFAKSKRRKGGKRGKRAKPLLRTTRKRVTKAGPTRVKVRLNRRGKRKLRRKGRVAVPVRVAFRPESGAPQSTTERAVFKKPSKRKAGKRMQRGGKGKRS